LERRLIGARAQDHGELNRDFAAMLMNLARTALRGPSS
jgi:hypothetical protein